MHIGKPGLLSKELEQLISDCIANNRSAQEKLYHRFFPELYSYCRRWVRDEETILSLVNDSFLKIFLKLHTLKSISSLQPWMQTILRNAIYSHFRIMNKWKLVEVDEISHWKDEEHVADAGITEQLLVQLMNTLPLTTREVFRLYVMEGYNHAEIAQLSNMSEGTSRWHISIARKRLRELWLKID